ncbi:hypothetical protein ORI20_16395 [Mycobacterium sp. CVI_P3]|uniref:Uncharacterized protein n=1 Tax=Mycobacterium pinniadriaticum TaxID=2994102 RepID=A0ABT3SFN1_9MYCO|nr:hypothetical protein [Mycobacterium pinniadriaticum]MCX2931863.1 hypothetical protein [Mycobacterium pinniadriaticum]MCX2938326.1 hypothetical protein [Mycobacterium pinniadriaticum]
MSGVVGRLVDELRTPVRVWVAGRQGCGRRTVARVLREAGVTVSCSSDRADLDVYVLAESVKPEDSGALAASPRPVVAVLTKADLAGFGGAGPVAAAAAHCRRLTELTGIPVYPLAGLAALAAVDDTVVDEETLDALRILTTDPADLGSTDGFAGGTHRLPHQVRRRLLARLDLFGIAHGVRALRDGADRAGLLTTLWQASAVDGLLAGIEAAAAPMRYQRLIDVPGGEGSASDEMVFARMAAAVEVMRAAGLTVDDDDAASTHLRRAITWQRYSRGPVSRLHRCAAADITRGSLRLWQQAGGIAEPLEPGP